MYKNHLKIAWRNLVRRKGHTVINIGGLAVGIAVCLLIFIIIEFELSFDNYHAKKDRIYRVLTEYHHESEPEPFTGSGVPYPLPGAIKANIPQVEEVSSIFLVEGTQIQVLDGTGKTTKKFKEADGVFFAEPSLFRIFDFAWLAGSAGSLHQPNSVVLTRETADRYFGSWKNAMGGTIKTNNTELLKVTGVLESVPDNTDLQIKAVIAYGTGFTSKFPKSDNWDGTNGNFGCFVLVRPNTSEASVNAQLAILAKENKPDGNNDTHLVQSLAQIHFDTESGNFSRKSISMGLINVLWIIAAFILLIACVNFVNLTTAQTVNRSKEIGVRKVLGSNKLQLRIQFLTETFLIVLLSVLLAIVISYMAVGQVGELLGLPLTPAAMGTVQIPLFLSLITVVVTLLAGFYPSAVLSGFNSVEALKNKVAKVGPKGISLRRGLVVFQFVIAQALIIGTFIIVKQMDYFMNQPLGFDKEAIINLAVPGDSAAAAKLDHLRTVLLSVNGVQNVSFGSNTPIDENGNNWSSFNFNQSSENTDFYSIVKATDHAYIDTYKMPLVAGRKLTPLEESTEFLVNETVLKKLGISEPEEALNKTIDLWGGIKGPIVGVLKDFQDHSFRDGISPVIMAPIKSMYNQLGVKLAMGDTPAALVEIEKIWNQTFPDHVFDYHFLDDEIASYYQQEQRLSQLYKISAAIAIFLSCLGLFGLASFMVAQRIKEAGIRKVLGATRENIVYLFSKEFVALIAIAFCIASPVAWYFMDQWLQDYAYRIDITGTVFMIGGLATLLIALTTVGYQAIKVANTNPVKSLRTE